MPYCPICGMESSETDDFCRHCGANLAEIRAAPTAPEDTVKTVLVQRIEGIKTKNPEMIMNLVDKERYTKFDDWPPFERQGSNALSIEAEALKVLKEYEYEAGDWKIDIFGDAAMASFTIKYRGTIRNRSFDVRSRVSTFLTRKDDGWKLVHEHWSSFPERHIERRHRFPW